MSQYQKQTGNAIFELASVFHRQRGGFLCRKISSVLTTRAIFESVSISRLRWTLLRGLVLILLLGLLWQELHPTTVHAARNYRPDSQSTQNNLVSVPVIVPLEATAVELLTHTADFTFTIDDPVNGGNRYTLRFDATYRFENPTADPVMVILNITEPSGSLTGEVSLSNEGLPLNLFQTQGVGYTTQLQIGGDTRTTVTLRYGIAAPETMLPLLFYPASTMSAWGGAPSIRVSIALPSSSSPESWLRMAPDGWRYRQGDDSDLLGVKWLYDAHIPNEPFVFEFIHPHQWQQLQQLATDATLDPTLYLALGDQYRELYNSVPLASTHDTIRIRFYGQALAAYTTGIEQLVAAGRSGPELGELYAALASLYRTQVADSSGSIDIAYSAAMVDAAQRALTELPTSTIRRNELIQWVVDGLQLALADAQANGAWIQALALVEQLAALPSNLVDPDILEQTKHSITVRQALQLLEEENRPAALALAGEELTNTALLPPREERTLFARWAISATIAPDTIELALQPLASTSEYDEALASFEELVASLQRSVDPTITLEWLSTPLPTLMEMDDPLAEGTTEQTHPLGRLQISAPSDSSFASLTTAMPTMAEWAFVYTLLRQLQPVIERETAWLNRETTIRLSLDLQNVAAEWNRMAINLDTQATALEAAAAARNRRDVGEAEEALRVRIQATNYRTAAQEWRKLSNTSGLHLQLQIPSGLQAANRSWLVTAQTPPLLAELKSSAGYLSAFITVLLFVMGGLLLLSSILWWLL